MAIKFKHLKKLIALANGNANEHECNAAARLVCKMLADYSWPADTVSQSQPFTGTHTSKPSPTGRYEPGRPPPGSDRATRRGPAETQPPKPHAGYADWWKVYNDLQEEARRKQEEARRKYDRDSFVNEYIRYDRPKPGPSSKYDPSQKKKLKCTKCGNEVETGFVGPPQVYVCTTCQWKGYP